MVKKIYNEQLKSSGVQTYQNLMGCNDWWGNFKWSTNLFRSNGRQEKLETEIRNSFELNTAMMIG